MALRDTALNILIRARNLATKPIGAVNRSLNVLNSTAARVGAAIATYFSARTVIRFFSGAVGEARSFEAQMARVAAISGATGEALQQLSDTAEEMGRATTFTAVEAAQGLELLSRAGLSAADAVATLPSVLALARGNALELSEAASLITSATAAMGLGFEESARTADVMARAASRSNTTVEELGTALSFAGPVAASMGLSLEETAAIIGRFSDAGIRGTRAGTSLAGILVRLQDPTSQASKEMAKLGISTQDPIEAIRQLAAAGEAANPALIAFGQRAGPALRALIAQGVEGVDDLVEALDNAAGAAEEQARIMNDNLDGAIKELSSAWQSFRKELADPLLDPIARHLRELAERIRGLSGSDALQRLRETLVEVFEDGVASIKRFAAEFGTMEEVLDRLKDRFRQTADTARIAFGILQVAGNALITVFHFVNTVVNGVFRLIVGQVRVIARGVNMIVQGLNRLGRVSDLTALKVAALTETLDEVADAAWERTRNAFDDLGESVMRTGRALEGMSKSGQRVPQTLDDVGDNAEGSAEKIARLTDALELAERTLDALVDAGADMDTIQEAMKRVAAAQEELSAALKEAGEDAKDSMSDAADESDRAAEAVNDQRLRVVELRNEYRRLRDSGTASVQEIGDALLRYRDAAREAQRQTGGLGDEIKKLDSRAVRDVSREFDRLVDHIRRGGEDADPLDFIDLSKMALDAEVALDTGDLESAQELAEQAAQGLRDLVDAGENTYGLEGLARRLQRIAVEAERAKEAGEEPVETPVKIDGQAAEDEAEFARHLMEERLNEFPPKANLALNVDEANREADDFRTRLEREPITITARLNLEGAGLGGDISGAVHHEAMKRGRL